MRPVRRPAPGRARGPLPPAACLAPVFLALTVLAARTGLAATLGEVDRAVDYAVRWGIKQVEIEEIDDPHNMPCNECHGDRVPAGAAQTAGPAALGQLTPCLDCHTDSDHHPVGIPVGEMGGNVKLPLEQGSSGPTITCLTCHYIHRPKKRNFLLRQYWPGSSRKALLCETCHKDNLIRYSPHSKDSQCSMCHIRIPNPATPNQDHLYPYFISRCNFCHGVLERSHFLALNPFGDPDINLQLVSQYVPLINGRFTCVTCHAPHADRKTTKELLRKEFLFLATLSKSINPHWNKILCFTCHDKEPEKGRPELRYSGDHRFLCVRCHNERVEGRHLHPIGKVDPSKEGLRIPSDAPMLGQDLTCLTCHDASLQESARSGRSKREGNPDFLRWGLPSRTEFCFKCHQEGTFKKVDVHAQITSTGSIAEEGCFFCHSKRPSGAETGFFSKEFFDTDPDTFCTPCHSEHPYEDHKMECSEETTARIKETQALTGVLIPTFEGRVVCLSCHDVHREGVKGKYGGNGGTNNKRMLRTAAKWELCACCHEKMM